MVLGGGRGLRGGAGSGGGRAGRGGTAVGGGLRGGCGRPRETGSGVCTWNEARSQGQAPPTRRPGRPSSGAHLPVVAAQDGLQPCPELHEGRALALRCVGGARGCRGRGTLLRRGVGTCAGPGSVGRPTRAAGGGPWSPPRTGALGQQQGQGRKDVHVPQSLLSLQQVLQQRPQLPWRGALLLGGRAVRGVEAQLRGNEAGGEGRPLGGEPGLRLLCRWGVEQGAEGGGGAPAGGQSLGGGGGGRGPAGDVENPPKGPPPAQPRAWESPRTTKKPSISAQRADLWAGRQAGLTCWAILATSSWFRSSAASPEKRRARAAACPLHTVSW